MERTAVLIHTPEILWSLPLFLYAETHYRFKYFFSFLRKAEPELIADAPHRLEPGQDIPLLILAKDGDKYPALLKSVRIELHQAERIVCQRELLAESVRIGKSLWSATFNIQRNQVQGWVDLHVFMTIQQHGRSRTYRSDNHRTSSHAPLRVYCSPDPLPRVDGLYFGDAHTHSDKTSDQVEFGIPVSSAVPLARSVGLSFFCVTDHSYDLDDSLTDYTVNDPAVPKWQALAEDIRKSNSRSKGFAVIRGEEVSARNAKEKNVHFLVLGDKKFFHGSGDGAEQWSQTRSEHSIPEILSLKGNNSVTFAAHPSEPVPFLQRLLLARGAWSATDFAQRGLHGIQFANGFRGAGFEAGYRDWLGMLLKGYHLTCLAGNDAHGNFNRFRQIGIPFLSIREHHDQLFGKMRTGVFLKTGVSQSSVLHSLAGGSFLISDGPVLNVRVAHDRKSLTAIGEQFGTRRPEFRLTARSTKEFGSLATVSVFTGVIGEQREQLLFHEQLHGHFEFETTFSSPNFRRGYLRAEVHTSSLNESDHCSHFCMTNPVWFDESTNRRNG